MRGAMVIYSFGFRHGLTVYGKVILPPDQSKQWKPYQVIGDKLVIDIRRILPKNPYHNKKLRSLRGDDLAVIAELEHTPGLEQAYHQLLEVVRQHQGHVYIGCTGGHHRSVYIANRLSRDLDRNVFHLNYLDK